MEDSDFVSPPVSEREAIEIVRAFLEDWEPPLDDEWVVTDVRPFEWGWAISWANRRFAEGSRESEDVYAKKGPYLVDRMSGAVALAGSAHGVEHYIALWRSGQWPEVSAR